VFDEGFYPKGRTHHCLMDVPFSCPFLGINSTSRPEEGKEQV
jgi:hypothetical protein